MKNFFSGFQIGPLKINPPLLLAPMEDVTNQPFRRIVKKIGQPSLMFTEFVSSMAIHYKAKKTYKKMQVHPEERPLGIQIFGADPHIMAETAQIAESFGADLIDINMGCWVPKVCKTGSGAALLKDPDQAEKIVKSVVNGTKLPVTVKVRAGWDYSLFAAPELAKRFESAGAKMITLHARFAKQGYEGKANWTLIENLRKAIQIPLIGNGDIKSPEDSIKMLRETGCDGVMIGREAISNPWALARIRARLLGEEEPAPPSLKERIDTALEHTREMIAYTAEIDSSELEKNLPLKEYQQAEIVTIRSLRGQLPLYIKGFSGAAEIRKKLTQCLTFSEIQQTLEAFLIESNTPL